MFSNNRINSQTFSEAEVSSGAMSNFIKILCDLCYSEKPGAPSAIYNDIRIHPSDCGSFVVEWVQLPWDGKWGGQFGYVDEDELIMRECILPDNTIIYCVDEEDYKERLDEWLKENPSYYRTPYGTWGNRDDDAELQKMLEAERKAKEET